MKKFLLAVVVVLASISSAFAAPACGGQIDVLGLTCELGGLTFSDFTYAFTPSVQPVTAVPYVLGLAGAPYTNVFGSEARLTFTVAPQYDWVDLIMNYSVTGGGIIGISNSVAPGGSITEYACTAPFSGSSCPGTTLASLATNQSATFAPQQTIYIHKDIQPPSALGGMSDFTDSVYTPEPMTFVLLGSGLLGVGLLRRRKA